MKELSPQQGQQLVQEGALLVDVREAEEYAEIHATSAQLLPLSELAERWEELPRQPLVLICRAGVRSARAAEFLEEKGYETYNLTGGTQAWIEQGLSTESNQEG